MKKILIISIIFFSLLNTVSAGELKKGQCPENWILHQNLKAPNPGEPYVRNGRYHWYTKGIVKEANILQKHLNRLEFNAGTIDGIIGPKTRGAILRLQKYLGTKQDGYIGPQTRALLNDSCGDMKDEKSEDKKDDKKGVVKNTTYDNTKKILSDRYKKPNQRFAKIIEFLSKKDYNAEQPEIKNPYNSPEQNSYSNRLDDNNNKGDDTRDNSNKNEYVPSKDLSEKNEQVEKDEIHYDTNNTVYSEAEKTPEYKQWTQASQSSNSFVKELKNSKDSQTKVVGDVSLCDNLIAKKVSIPNGKHGKINPSCIVWHRTHSGNINLSRMSKDGIGAQLWVAKDGSIVQVNELTDKVWHVKTSALRSHSKKFNNGKCVGVEVVGWWKGGKGDDGYYEELTNKQKESVKKIAGCLAGKFKLDLNRDTSFHGYIATNKKPTEGIRVYREINNK